MTASPRTAILAAGLASGGLYVLAGSDIPSILLAFLPYFPLLYIGLNQGVSACARATVLACGIAAIGLGMNGLFVFAFLMGLPSVLLVQRLLLFDGARWHPSGLALSQLALLYFGIAVAILFAVAPDGAIPNIVPPAAEGETEWMRAAREVMVQFDFLIIALMIWLQVLVIYALAVLANFWLTGKGQALRPTLAVRPFLPPAWIPALILLAGLASLINEPVIQLAAKAGFVVVLFPYFLMGIGRLHARSDAWRNRTMWLSLTYFLLLSTMPYSMIAAIGVGLYEHGRYLSNRVGTPGGTGS